MVGDRSRSGGSVLHLVVACVELRRVSGLRALVVKRSRAVCCAGWLGCGRRAALLGRCDIARGGPGPVGDKLEQPASVAKAVKEAVHQ